MRWIFWQVKFGNGVLIEKSGFPVVRQKDFNANNIASNCK
jgi:hypothetical protein